MDTSQLSITFVSGRAKSDVLYARDKDVVWRRERHM